MSAFGRSMQQLSNAELRSTIVRLVRTQIWDTFENPSGSNFAYYLAIFFMMMVFISSFAFCIETLPRFEDDAQAGDVFYGIELFSLVIFTMEYVLRSICCPHWTSFVVQPLNVVDLVAILPFYLQLMLPMSVDSVQVVRTIRLVRVLRILRLGVKFGRLKIIGSSIAECADMLVVSTAMGALAIVIFSTLIYYAEHGDYVAAQDIFARSQDIVCENLDSSVATIWNADGTLNSSCTYVESPYKSIPASFWWCVVTLMTVGYGDNVPVTSAGRFIASMTMICSVLLLALPISVIGTEFTRQWIDYKADVEYEKDRKIVAPRFQKLIRATRLQLKAAQETQQDMRARQMNLDDKIQTIKSLVMRRNAETMFLKRKIVARSGLSVIGFEKFERQLDMDDLDLEMRGMFMSHKEYKQTLREVDTIWSGDQLQRFSEFLINANHVLEGLCNDDFDMVSQEMDSLFFEAWRVKSKLSALYSTGAHSTKKRWKRAGMVAKLSSVTEAKE
jgi:potassium voltage-gated channel Shab-related subfamily B protein 2